MVPALLPGAYHTGTTEGATILYTWYQTWSTWLVDLFRFHVVRLDSLLYVPYRHYGGSDNAVYLVPDMVDVIGWSVSFSHCSVGLATLCTIPALRRERQYCIPGTRHGRRDWLICFVFTLFGWISYSMEGTLPLLSPYGWDWLVCDTKISITGDHS